MNLGGLFFLTASCGQIHSNKFGFFIQKFFFELMDQIIQKFFFEFYDQGFFFEFADP